MTKLNELNINLSVSCGDEESSVKSAATANEGTGLFEGSPIIIGGGGSVNINFREGAGHYVPVVESPGVYTKAGDEIDTILIVDATGVLNDNLLQYVNRKNCEVRIHTKIGGASESLIKITSQPNGPLQLSFVAAEFVPHSTDPNRRPHYNRERKLTDVVEVIDKGTSPNETRTFPIPTDGVCTITVYNAQH